MRQLNKVESILFAIGAVMMVVGVGCTVFRLAEMVMAPIFAIGAFLFSCIQLSQRYHGQSITIKRLRRIMDFADIMFLLAALLMVENAYQWLLPIMAKTIDGYNAYKHYIYNNWVIALLIAAILEMYTMTRISKESEKE